MRQPHFPVQVFGCFRTIFRYGSQSIRYSVILMALFFSTGSPLSSFHLSDECMIVHATQILTCWSGFVAGRPCLSKRGSIGAPATRPRDLPPRTFFGGTSEHVGCGD